jgi:antiviral helicase SKI2
VFVFSFSAKAILLQVLKRMGYLNQHDVVELKGKVACELHSHEVLLTELLFENVFGDYEPGEIAALLSSLVFQQVCLHRI